MAILQSVSGEPSTRRLLLVPAAPRMPRQIEEWLAEDNTVIRGEPTRDELLRDSESSYWDAAVCWIGDATEVSLSMLPLLRQFRHLPVVGIGDVDTARVAVEALWRGASNYVVFREGGEGKSDCGSRASVPGSQSDGDAIESGIGRARPQ